MLAGQPLLGLWPGDLADALRHYLEEDGDRAMRSWIAHASARQIVFAAPLANINTRDELAAYLAGR